MTNTAELNHIIDASGYKRGYIAQHLGISRQSLAKKIGNATEFKGSEISSLAKLLRIKDLESIFFTVNVINNHPKKVS